MTSEEASALSVSDGRMMLTTQTGVDHYHGGAGVNLTAAQGVLGTREVYWSLPQPFLGNKVQYTHTCIIALILDKIIYQLLVYDTTTEQGLNQKAANFRHIK